MRRKRAAALGDLDSAKRIADLAEKRTIKPAAAFNTKKEAKHKHNNRNR
jgi:hypothetical protein